MPRHLSEEELLDLLEGRTSARCPDHVGGCAHCQARLEHAREGWSLARQAEVPEPPPGFWEVSWNRVERRIAADERPVGLWQMGPWLAAAAAVVALVALGPRVGPTVGSPERVPAWVALPASDEDPGLAVLAALSPEAEEVGPVAHCGLPHCLLELTDEESVSLSEALREELEGRTL